MKSDRLPRILLFGFVSALVLYIGAFSLINNRRSSHGPWRVVFGTDAEGKPGLLVEQEKLKISERIVFPDQHFSETNLASAFVFDDPTKTKVPFGEVIFQDLTFLPGTVTLNLFGHEIELLPRTLIIDKQELAWEKGKVRTVTGPRKFQPKAK